MSWAVQGAWGQLRCPQGAAMRPVGHLCLSRVAAAAERLIPPAKIRRHGWVMEPGGLGHAGDVPRVLFVSGLYFV